MKPIQLAVLAALLSTGLAHAGANLVQNGSFETGSFSSWQTQLGDDTTFVDGSSTTGTNYDQATDGHWLAFFGSTAASGGASISQLLATMAGAQYTLSFDLANSNGGSTPSNAFAATTGSDVLLSFSALGDQGYQHVSATFTASGATTLLTLGGYNDASYIELDNVAVMQAVPEPSTTLLYLAGLVSVGWFVARSRQPNKPQQKRA